MNATATTTTTETETARYRLPRDGDRDLVFDGVLLGDGEDGTGGEFRRDWTRGERVSLYRTAGGRLIAYVHRWTRWQGERNHDAAGVCDELSAADEDGGAAHLLSWLREQGGGKLSRAELAAWNDAELGPEVIE
jgi:hypothetical protein